MRSRYMRTTYRANLPDTFNFKKKAIGPATLPASCRDVSSRWERVVEKCKGHISPRVIRQQAMDVLQLHEHVLQLGASTYFLWLTQSEFDVLSNAYAEPIIGEWLKTLSNDGDIGEGSKSLGNGDFFV